MKQLPPPLRTEKLDTSYGYVWALGAVAAVFVFVVVAFAVVAA